MTDAQGASVRIAIAGLGTVGTGVVRMLNENREKIRQHCGGDIEITAICDNDPGKSLPPDLGPIPLVRDAGELIEKHDFDIFVELIGGTGAARELVTAALEKGRHVVTANKALLSEYWGEIFDLARRTGSAIRFESSVMAGVPVIRGLNDGLAGNTISSILGILNGTTNFILTEMDRHGVPFETALAAAREHGLCEADASLDIDGHDAAHKLAILASLATHTWVSPDQIHTSGIAEIDECDVRYAAEQFGYRLKLLAIFKSDNGKFEARVHPAFIPATHPLASVSGAFNACLIDADRAGPLMLYGLGAGARPAASGVVSDIVTLARAVTADLHGPSLLPTGVSGQKAEVRSIAEVRCKFYLRFQTLDEPGVLSHIAGALGKRKVSIAACYQHGRARQGAVPVIMITHEARDGDVQDALAELARADFIRDQPALIRIEESEECQE